MEGEYKTCMHSWLFLMVNEGKYTSPMDPMGMKFSTLQGIKRRWYKDFKPVDSNQLEWFFSPQIVIFSEQKLGQLDQVIHNWTPSKASQARGSKVLDVQSNEAPSSMEVWIH